MMDVAYAQGAGAPAGGGFSMLVPLLLMFAVFYFLLIRPQQKKQRRHQDMLKALKVGDRVITSGGLCGTIVEGGDPLVKLEIADRVRVEVGRSYIAGRLGSARDAKEIEAPQPEGRAATASSGGLLGKLFGK
ncbi:MAG: preprotein translocase subunit YajC [Candidatus Methylomirabilales bacterium]